jgi:hypothetical protein
LKINHRLRFAFRLCKELGIDDPVTWMDNVPARVLDAWLAYESVVADELKDSEKSKGMSPIAALHHMSQKYGN